MTYRGNGAVASLCLSQYADLMSQYYPNLNEELSQKCSAAVNVFINVSFSDTKPRLVDDNLVQVCNLILEFSFISQINRKLIKSFCFRWISV